MNRRSLTLNLNRLFPFVLGALLPGCPMTAPTGNDNGIDNIMDDMIDDGPGDNDEGGNMNDENDDDNPVNGGTGEVPAVITGTELLIEGELFNEADGGFRQRSERFTATWSLEPVDDVTSQAFIGDTLVDVISGNVNGQAQLTYTESGANFTPGLDCPSDGYAGQVEWSTPIAGTYQYIPVLDQLTITAMADNVSSPEYPVAYMTAGCPEFDSTSFSSYFWGGPGIGAWGGVAIVVEGGAFDQRLDNVSGADTGAADYYDIHVDAPRGRRGR